MLEKDLQCVIKILCGKQCDSQSLDWYSVFGFLELNRLSGRFYRIAVEQGLAIPALVLKKLKRTADYQAERNKQFGLCLKELTNALESLNVPYAVLKGNALVQADFHAQNGNAFTQAVYEIMERTSNDIDLLVSPKDVGKVEKTLIDCGFTQGYFNDALNTIRTTDRRGILERRMGRGETVPFQRMTDCAQMRHIEIDINFSLDYLPNSMQEVRDQLLSKTKCYTTRDGGKLRSLESVDFLIHLILHQYKEMREFSMVMRGKDLEAYKLLDIFLLLQSVSQSELYRRVTDYGIEEQTAVVLKVLVDIFSETKLCAELKEIVQKVKPSAEWVVDPTKKDKPYLWTADPIERILCFPHSSMLIEKN